MSYPSLWLALGGMLGFIVISALLSQAASRAAKRSANRPPFPAMLMNVLSFVYSAWLFFSVTGHLPWPLIVGGVAMTLFGGVIVFLIYGAAGLLHPFRDRDINTLTHAFLKPVQQGLSALLLLVLPGLVLPVVMLFLAFQKAHQVDLQSNQGLFEIGLLLMSLQTGFWFILTNFMNGFTMLSKETSRQQRIQSFAASFRTYLISGWIAVYPFYAFKSDELRQQPLLVWAGAGVYILVFLTFVLIPYLVGRTRYQAQKNQILQKVSDECRRVSIATDPGVDESYRQSVMSRVFGNIRIILDQMGKDRPFFKYMTPHAASLFSDAAGYQPAPPPPGAPGDLAVIDQGGQVPVNYQPPPQEPEKLPAAAAAIGLNIAPLEEVQYLDYRLFVLAAAERLTTYRANPATIRGAAAEISVDCDRWLQTREGRSGALAFMGVIVSAILPLIVQHYSDSIQSMFDGVAAFTRAQ